ncbi:peptidase [Haematospirillum jordaniae]|uniref:Peptidase n=1 Tax=Haematospirillum jordaniae TaxID=1549855 RepID=A0A143DDR6_9PROT|nr:imelysin family protein [Haematospirillum jordaniae]AMW34857.1 peptidase [Haematospirillum jordaniae]NKD56763.1 peptidase [Haematospirillum jordaniae]NKD59081.1 peptidase [Haematospirillum jordaniae]NKD66687.1 peptidase [Haematospirillum jordaniae]NKD79083.1 peptidase [Haematospirillum jordaniae]
MRAFLATATFLTAATLITAGPALAASKAQEKDVVSTYITLAHAKFEDAEQTARVLQKAVDALVAHPDEHTLSAARKAWIEARVPYMQTEVYRFGNPAVDDWEGRVNAWPLDEGLIDYVDTASYGEHSDENAWFRANVIANPVLEIGGQTIDATVINKDLLQKLHEIDEIEANVATGYHAVEFLLWGQDRNGTGPSAGDRKATDFDLKACTNGHCDRRAAYLKAATDLLVEDLAEMTSAWDKDGAIAKDLLASEPKKALTAMLTGMGSLSYGELAGERMKLGLMLHDPEEEHDCFSDNTHASHYYNAVGIRSIYSGSYTRPDGRTVSGKGLKILLPTAERKELSAALDKSVAKMQVLMDMAAKGTAYDQMLGENNPTGNKAVQDAVDALVAQTRSIERATAALGLGILELEGSDSLDAPEKVSGNS